MMNMINQRTRPHQLSNSEKQETLMLIHMVSDARDKMIKAYATFKHSRQEFYELAYVAASTEYFRILDTLHETQKTLELRSDERSEKRKLRKVL